MTSVHLPCALPLSVYYILCSLSLCSILDLMNVDKTIHILLILELNTEIYLERKMYALRLSNINICLYSV